MENDFGFVHVPNEASVEQTSEKKPASKVTQRSIVKKEKVETAIDPERVAGTATTISNSLPLEIPDLNISGLVDQFGRPLATFALLGLAGKKLLSGSNAPEAPVEAKPDLRDFGKAPVAPPPSTEPNVPKGWEDIVARSNANAAAKAADAAAKANPVPTGYASGIPSAVSPMSQLTQPAPQAPAAPVQQAPAAPAPQAPAAQQTLTQTVETGGDVGQALKTDVAKMVDEASGVAPQLSKREQSMKNWLLNQYGAKNYPEHAEQAYEQVKKILGYTPAYPENSKGGSLLPEEKGKILDWRKESLAGPKVNLSHTMKKALKVGGPALAAMVATTEFANAKTAEDRANAGTNLLGAILPPGMDILSAGAPGVQQQQINQAALLGSPYAQTEWAKTQRLREKAGAGRGMAPPSAYQR